MAVPDQGARVWLVAVGILLAAQLTGQEFTISTLAGGAPGWLLLAAHVRSNHVHVVVEAEELPEKVMNDFKSYASRKLNTMEPDRKRWARHGSTRWLWKEDSVRNAIRYVVDEQGEPMALFVREV